MTHLVDKDRIVAEIEKFMYSANLEADIASTGECFDEKVARAKYQLCKQIRDSIVSLEVKEVDVEKEKVENIKKQCPFREVVCSMYQDHPLKCSGACAFVSDRITLEKKHLCDIQNIPVDEEKLRNDRRNSV